MAPNLTAFLDHPLRLGNLQVAGPLTVAPLFGARTGARLLSLEQALDQGASAAELPEPEVGRIVIRNPTRHALLLLDGEEVIGAQQNRIVDGTVVVPADTVRTIHVCCVEQGRWDGRRRNEHFRASSQVMPPTLRGVKSRTARQTGRGDQSAVWEQVGRSIVETATYTMTSAVADVFDRHAARLDELVSAFRCEPDQVGMMVGVGSRLWSVDVIADPEAFGSAFPRLMRGYALDVVGTKERGAVSRPEMELALRRLLERPTREAGVTATERTLRFEGEGLPVEGSATLVGDRLVAASVLLPGAPQGEVAVDERRVRTSETDPIEVTWLRSPRGGLGITLAPGKRGRSGSGPRWERDVERDLVRLRAQHGADALVCLLTDEELARFGLSDYEARAAAVGLTLHRLPVRAGDVPRSVQEVRRLVAEMRRLLETDRRVVVHCGAGLGRSGVIAGCTLVELGASADEALAALTARHPEKCPESAAQRDFVRHFAARRAVSA